MTGREAAIAGLRGKILITPGGLIASTLRIDSEGDWVNEKGSSFAPPYKDCWPQEGWAVQEESKSGNGAEIWLVSCESGEVPMAAFWRKVDAKAYLAGIMRDREDSCEWNYTIQSIELDP
jgi:hypothetical protein